MVNLGLENSWEFKCFSQSVLMVLREQVIDAGQLAYSVGF